MLSGQVRYRFTQLVDLSPTIYISGGWGHRKWAVPKIYNPTINKSYRYKLEQYGKIQCQLIRVIGINLNSMKSFSVN
jgi:hypothetical protein